VSLGDSSLQQLQQMQWKDKPNSNNQEAVARALEQAFEVEKAAKAGASTTQTKTQPAASPGEGDENANNNSEASMWPALYMLEAYVRHFNSQPQ
jgi:hypothetical protein